jgi:RNA polymerase sigma factor for flagellar operon FliA
MATDVQTDELTTQTLWDRYGEHRTAETKRALVLRYLDLVRYVVVRLGRPRMESGRTLDTEDMIQYGILGLIEAVDRYTPETGVKFETYAIPRIKGAILDELRNLDWVPRSVRANAKRVERMSERVSQEMGREAADQEIAGRLSISVGELHRILSEANTLIAPHQPGVLDGSGPDQVVEESPGPLEALSDQEARKRLVDAVSDLPERSRTVIALYYYEGLRFGDIARILRISESRVSQIHSEVLRGLRKQLADIL